MSLNLFWPSQKCYLWNNACHPCDQPSSVIWQHRNAPRWAWREIRRHVVRLWEDVVTVVAWSRERTLNSVLNLGKTAAKTMELMRQVYGDNCLSHAQIFRWQAQFKSGVETIKDEARHGHPFSVRNERLIAKVRKRIQEHCVTVRMTAY